VLNYCTQRSAVCGVGAESRWRVFLHSWCDAGLCGYYFILALAKTVTPGGSPRREPGPPAPPLKVFHFDQKILAVRKANDIYRPVSTSSLFYLSDLPFKNGNIFLNSSPNDLYVYAQIVVNEFISHSSNLFPGDFKIDLLCI